MTHLREIISHTSNRFERDKKYRGHLRYIGGTRFAGEEANVGKSYKDWVWPIVPGLSWRHTHILIQPHKQGRTEII